MLQRRHRSALAAAAATTVALGLATPVTVAAAAPVAGESGNSAFGQGSAARERKGD